MKNETPLISIITVVFNAVELVDQTIQSVLIQSYPSIQYIIIDGGSTDGTMDIVNNYKHQLHYHVSEKDKGIYDAMNKGIKAATGKWTLFMNAGDKFYSSTVLSEVFQSSSFEFDILYGDAIVEYPTFESPFPKVPLEKMWKRMPFCHQACFIKTAILKNNSFDLNYAICADYDLIYRLYLKGAQFHYLRKIISYYDYRDGLSKKQIIKSAKERQQIVLKYKFSFIKWSYYFGLLIYLSIAIQIKRIIGNKATAWLTRFLKP